MWTTCAWHSRSCRRQLRPKRTWSRSPRPTSRRPRAPPTPRKVLPLSTRLLPAANPRNCEAGPNAETAVNSGLEVGAEHRVRTGDLRLGKTKVKVRTRFVGSRGRHSASLHILQANALPCAQARPGFLDARKETCIILKPVVEPVVLRREPDEDACRLSVTGDDHLAVLGFPQVPGEVVLDLRQRNFLHSGLPNRASDDSASDLR